MRYFICLCVSIFVLSCQEKKNKQSQQDTPSPPLSKVEHEGKALMEIHCYVCHSPTASENEGRIAPPMVAIKAHYIREGMTKETFVEAVRSFTEHPRWDNAYLKDAVQRFGLMPKQIFPKGSVEKIADFMYAYQIEEPTWFAAHFSRYQKDWVQTGKKYQVTSKQHTFSDLGVEYALHTKKILGKNLMNALQTKGILYALKFCNHRAMPITDSMSTLYRANIRRVSDKYRNPRNAANEEEKQYIRHFEKEIAQQKNPVPIALTTEKKVRVYYPITTNSMCLQCHGKNVQPEVLRAIKDLYPQDLAMGYEENQVRGIWSISFEKR